MSGSKVPRFQRFLTGGSLENYVSKRVGTRDAQQVIFLQKGNRSFFTGTLEPRHFLSTTTTTTKYFIYINQ